MAEAHGGATLGGCSLVEALEVDQTALDAVPPEVRWQALPARRAALRAGVERQIAAEVREIYVFQLPRVHAGSLFRFSEEVIAAFQ